jgi:hypothetical protein
MNRAIVRCRCGHQVLSKEVLRTDLYERRSAESSAEYVCVRYRCRRCRRLGEAFVAEKLWDWSALEGDNSELSENERDRFREAEPISESEMHAFHEELENFSRLAQASTASPLTNTSDASLPEASALSPEAKSSAPPDVNAAAKEETQRDSTRQRGASPKTPEKPAPGATRGDTPRSENI